MEGLFAAVDRTVRAVVGRSEDLGPAAPPKPDLVEHAAKLITIQALAFHMGYISVERLAEVSFSRFLNLAQELSRAESSSSPRPDIIKFLAILTKAWVTSLEEILAGRLISDTAGKCRHSPFMSAGKRAEFLKELMRGGVVRKLVGLLADPSPDSKAGPPARVALFALQLIDHLLVLPRAPDSLVKVRGQGQNRLDFYSCYEFL